MGEVFFICQYDIPDMSHEHRMIYQSAVNKANTVINTLNSLGYKVNIISMASSKDSKPVKGRFTRIFSGNTLRLFSCIGKKNKAMRILNFLFLRTQFVLFLITHLHRNDIVFVYHALEYSRIVRMLKLLIRFKLVVELEELYADVLQNEKIRALEIREINAADAFVFPSEKLDQVINKKHLPKAVAYGPYEIKNRTNVFSDDKTHLVYAGTFMENKGVIEAIHSAKYLPDSYVLHILGKGSEDEVRRVILEIDMINNYINCASVMYEGELIGDDFYNFLSSCDIGISPQDPTALFNNTSFPSKIITYISCGLRVVSTDIETIKNSDVGKEIFFFHNQDPESIAKTIKFVNCSSEYNYKDIILELQKKFKSELLTLINDLGQ